MEGLKDIGIMYLLGHCVRGENCFGGGTSVWVSNS